MKTNGRRGSRSRRQGGYTLVEAVLAILVMGITGTALMSSLLQTKLLQEDTRRVNALNRTATKFVESLREISYLSLDEALPDGEYGFTDFQYYQGSDGQMHSLIDSAVLYEISSTCAEFRVSETIRVSSTADRIKVSIRFVSQGDSGDIPVHIATEISENGINFR